MLITEIYYILLNKLVFYETSFSYNISLVNGPKIVYVDINTIERANK